MTRRWWFALFLSIGISPGTSQAADSLDKLLRDIRLNTNDYLENLPATAKIGTSSVSLPDIGFSGQILVDGDGFPLYMCDADTENVSKCTGECTEFHWPLVQSSTTKPEAVNGADANLIDPVFARPGENVNQASFNKHPVYSYLADTSSSTVRAHCVESYGCKWRLLAADGKPIACQGEESTPAGGDGGNPGEGGNGGGGGEDGGWSSPCGSDGCTGCQGGNGSCDSSCGDTWVCGWDPGYECLNNHDNRPKCCKRTGNPQCKGDGGGDCGSKEVCGWTPGWKCWDNHMGRSSCCWNAHDSSCTGY